MLILLPLVVPQLIAGLVFGYARVTFGLWSDMLLHMMHNGLLISLVLLSKGV
jgi:membrane protease YdiL (CAAX protease family)